VNQKKEKAGKKQNAVYVRFALGGFFILVFLFSSHVAVRDFLAEVDFYRAYRLLNSPAYLQAEAPTSRAIRLNPQNGYTYYYYGIFLKKLGKNREALKQLSFSLNIIPHPASVLRQMAEIELEEKNYKKSLDYYRKALLYDPVPRHTPAKIWFDYGRAAQGAGKSGEALAAFRRCANIENPPLLLGHSISFVLGYLGLFDAGVIEYLYQVEKEPRLAGGMPQFALGLTQAGLLDFGKALFNRLDSLGRLDAGGLCLLATFFYHQKQYDKALEILSRAEKADSSQANVYLLKGEIYFQRGQKEKMKKMYQRFLELSPDAPQKSQLQKRMQE